MAELTNISLSRGAPSLDIIAVDELSAAAQRAFERDPGGALAYGTSAGYPRLLEWLAKQHGVPPSSCSPPTARCRPTRSCSSELVSPATSSSSRRPPTTARCSRSRKLGAEVLAIPLEADGIDVGALEAALEEGARPGARPHHPQLPEPRRLHAVAREAPSPARARGRYGFAIFEDDPYVELRFEGEPLPTMLELDDERRGRVRVVVLQDGRARGSGSATWSARAELIGAMRKRATETYISPNMVAQAIVAEFCQLGRDRRLDRHRQGGAARAPRRDLAPRSTAPPRRALRRPPRAATSSGSTCRRAPTSRRSPAARRSAAWCSSRAPTS